MRNTTETWGGLARLLHWSMAGLILAQVVLGKVGHEMARSPLKLDLMTWHKSLGVLLLLLAVLRLGWRWINPTPAPPPGLPAWQRNAARLTHAALYGLLLLIPLSGWLLISAENIPFRVFWLLPWPSLTGPNDEIADFAEEAHELLANGLLWLLALHAGAALKHHFLDRNGVLTNMLKGRHGP